MTKEYNKLVRDRIPQIIRSSGGECQVEVLENGAYLQQLEKKLSEELAEYLQSGELEELADLLEVMQALVAAKGCSWQELIAIQDAKRESRGGFQEKLLLKSVTQTK